MAENVKLKVEIDGLPYTLISDTSVGRLQETAGLVDTKVKEIRKALPHYSGTRAAMLVALQLAEELLQLQDEYLDVLQEAEIGAQLPTHKEPSS